MIEFIQKGGPLMWLLLAASVFAVAIFVERLLFLHRVAIPTGDFLSGLANLIRRGNYAEAQLECRATPVPITICRIDVRAVPRTKAISSTVAPPR